MKRRSFLRHTGHIAALPLLLNRMSPAGWLERMMYSATETDRVLVMIFLNGGNDGLNTVIPLDQMGVLQSLRPHVVLPEASLLRLSGQDKLALHPSLRLPGAGLFTFQIDGHLDVGFRVRRTPGIGMGRTVFAQRVSKFSRGVPQYANA